MAEAEKIVRSRYRGLRDVHIARILTNTATAYTTDTPVKLARAVTAKISDKWSAEPIYSDDGTEEIVTSYEGTEIELEVATLAPQDRALLFGQLYENGFLTKNKDDLAPEVAIGYRTRRMNGKYEFAWHYCGKFGQGNDDEFETQADKISPKTATVKGNFNERQIDGNYQILVDESNLVESETTMAAARAAIADWFGKVQEPKAAEDTPSV